MGYLVQLVQLQKGKYTSTLILNESDGGYLSGTYEVTSSNS